jgi:thioredoxin-dependent peroxiredoxin
MRRLAKAATLIAALALPLVAAHAALEVGARAPSFDTKASIAGKDFDFNLQKALKKGPVVLYFFPKVFTKGCTIEANQFSEAADEFNKLGATVVGVSADPIEEVRKFSVLECRNKFAVGVATPAMIKDYDVALIMQGLTGKSNRTSYVIAPNGKIVHAFTALKPDGHVSGTLEAVKALKAKH